MRLFLNRQYSKSYHAYLFPKILDDFGVFNDYVVKRYLTAHMWHNEFFHVYAICLFKKYCEFLEKPIRFIFCFHLLIVLKVMLF